MTGETSVQEAIDSLIAAFGEHRRDDYFAHFAPDATFVFHDHPVRLESREEYERLWRSWEDEAAFAVISCRSTAQKVQLFGPRDAPGEVAVFSHDVETVSSSVDGTATTQERETIVLERRASGWLAVHEHLSVAPDRDRS